MKYFNNKNYVVALFYLSTIGCYTLKKQTEYYGVPTNQYKNIVFVLDISGSMEGVNEPSVAGHNVSAVASRGSRVVSNTLGNGMVARFAGQQLRRESTKLGAARRELIPAIKGA